MKKVLPIILLIIVTVGIVYVAQFQSPSVTTNKLQVVGSFYPMTYFASQIAGDKADVINITPAGVEPHDYDLSTGDIARMEKSRLIVLNGEVEVWGEKITSNLSSNKLKVVTVGNGLFTRQVQEGDSTGTDPHVWLSPLLAKRQAQRIAQALSQVDPENKATYDINEQALEKRFDQLHTLYKQALKWCPKKDIVTAHAAFGYLAEAYGLTQVSIAGISPDEEPSPQQLVSVAKFVQEHEVKYIFFESLVSPKLAQTIATETGAQTLELNPLEGLSSEDLQQGKDYFTVMMNNLHNLQIALECQK